MTLSSKEPMHESADFFFPYALVSFTSSFQKHLAGRVALEEHCILKTQEVSLQDEPPQYIRTAATPSRADFHGQPPGASTYACVLPCRFQRFLSIL